MKKGGQAEKRSQRKLKQKDMSLEYNVIVANNVPRTYSRRKKTTEFFLPQYSRSGFVSV